MTTNHPNRTKIKARWKPKIVTCVGSAAVMIND